MGVEEGGGGSRSAPWIGARRPLHTLLPSVGHPLTPLLRWRPVVCPIPRSPPPHVLAPPLPSQVVPLELGAVSSKLPGATNAMVLRQPNLAIGGDWVVEIIANK